MELSITGTDDDICQYMLHHGNSWVSRESIISVTSTSHDVCQYMLHHGNSWLLQETIMTSSRQLVSSYLTSQENIREVIKIEESDLICSDGVTEDSKVVYTFHREEYMTYGSDMSNIQFPSKPHPLLHERHPKTEEPCKCDKCGETFTMKRYRKEHQIIHSRENYMTCEKYSLPSSTLKRDEVLHTGEKAFKCDECGKQF